MNKKLTDAVARGMHCIGRKPESQKEALIRYRNDLMFQDRVDFVVSEVISVIESTKMGPMLEIVRSDLVKKIEELQGLVKRIDDELKPLDIGVWYYMSPLNVMYKHIRDSDGSRILYRDNGTKYWHKSAVGLEKLNQFEYLGTKEPK